MNYYRIRRSQFVSGGTYAPNISLCLNVHHPFLKYETLLFLQAVIEAMPVGILMVFQHIPAPIITSSCTVILHFGT